MTNRLPQIVAEVFSFLNENVDYAVLRNYEGLPYENKSRDIDIIITKSDYRKIRNDFVKLLVSKGYKIVSFFESERLQTIVCGRVSGSIFDLLQFDFFFHTSAYGNILLDAKTILDSKIFENGVYHVSKEFEFLDKYLYLKYIGAEYPQKYNKTKESIRNSEELKGLLQELFKISDFDELESKTKSEFRKIIRKEVGFSIKNRVTFYSYYLLNQIKYKGYSFGFTGPDGSGKTTVLDCMVDALKSVYSQIDLYHFRPTVFGNLGEVAHSVGIKKEVDKDYSKPHRGNKVGPINSFCRLVFYSIDYIVGYCLKVRRKLCKRQLVVFDRYYTDIICDSRRSRIFLSTKFLYWFGRLFIPSLDYNILLTASTETILNRKQELDKEGIEAINSKIEYLSTKKGYKKILNEGTPQQTACQILDFIFNEQNRKNLKRIK